MDSHSLSSSPEKSVSGGVGPSHHFFILVLTMLLLACLLGGLLRVISVDFPGEFLPLFCLGLVLMKSSSLNSDLSNFVVIK